MIFPNSQLKKKYCVNGSVCFIALADKYWNVKRERIGRWYRLLLLQTLGKNCYPSYLILCITMKQTFLPRLFSLHFYPVVPFFFSLLCHHPFLYPYSTRFFPLALSAWLKGRQRREWVCIYMVYFLCVRRIVASMVYLFYK